MARITVKVHPRAKRSGFAGQLGDAWKLDLAAPPVERRANEECARYLAEWAGVARSAVRIVTGANARRKVIEIAGMDETELQRRLVGDKSL